MTVSILIVSYNVCYFLEHCLLSLTEAVAKASESIPGFKAGIIVTDNQSNDPTMRLLPAKFPGIRFIDAGENLGFGKANNSMLEGLQSEYVFFLNPDTIVPDDFFLKQLKYISDEKTGACGFRMIDGTGSYLPESKRGFPGLWNAFTKMSGLSSFFPHSRLLAGYYQGHLNAKKNQVVPVLSGAAMFVRRKVLDVTGGFDERFFMYAEDIDLSYRIVEAGYINRYIADNTIIHFKGESTRKDRKYIEHFYGAMILFVKKHFKGFGAAVYTRLLELLITARIAVSPKSDTKRPGKSSVTPFDSPLLLGDRSSCKLLEGLLAQRLIKPADVKPRVTIYCLGKTFGYGKLIHALETAKETPVLIYHPNAAAVIGSHSKNEQGSIFLLPGLSPIS